VSRSKTIAIAVAVLALTFVAGVGVGIFGSHMAILHGGHGAERFPNAMVNRLDRRLDLTDAQRAQVAAIIKRRHARIDAIWGAARPQVRAEIDRTNEEIERVLTPEQRAQFKRMRMRLHGSAPMHPVRGGALRRP
jgi:Spy/CpxP family protein refolding chaperone